MAKTSSVPLARLCALTFTSVTICTADSVLLDNGDRITGDIHKLENDRLEVRTDYAGTIEIAWKQVVEIDTAGVYRVETGSGFRCSGTVSAANGSLLVAGESGTTTLERGSIKTFAPLPREGSERLLAPLSGSLDLGYNLARGSSNLSQSSVRLNARYRTDRWQMQFEGNSLFSRQFDAESTNRHAGTLRVDRYFTPERFTFMLAALERDQARGLGLRSNLGGGLGWKFINSGDKEAALLGGFTFTNERFRETPDVQPTGGGSTAEGLVALDFKSTLAGSLQLVQKLSVTPDLLGSGRFRTALESGVRVPLLNRYLWSLQLYNRFDSRPPIEVQKMDYGAISSFGVSF
jgi:hypothetical protein